MKHLPDSVTARDRDSEVREVLQKLDVVKQCRAEPFRRRWFVPADKVQNAL